MQTFFFGPVGILPALLIVIVALQSAAFFFTRSNKRLPPVQYEAIDGLRGYLAIFVFICHASAWYHYLRTGAWAVPPSRLFNHFGHTSVSLFFMITAFLFCRKLMSTRVDWSFFYLARLLRIYPVYAIAILVLLGLVGILTNFTLGHGESWLTLASQSRKWLTFALKNTPNVNGVKDTWLIISGVVWTLRYEWLFYGALPIVGLLFGKQYSSYVLILSVSITAFLLLCREFKGIYLMSFAGGMLAAALYKRVTESGLLNSRLVSVGVVLLVLIVPNLEPGDVASLLINSVIFVFIGSGNSLFGLLSGAKARMLGQLSYSVYLMHGLLLFILFRFGLGFPVASQLSPVQHWLYVLSLTPLLTGLSFLLHVYVELPAIRFTPVLYEKLHLRFRTVCGRIPVLKTLYS